MAVKAKKDKKNQQALDVESDTEAVKLAREYVHFREIIDVAKEEIGKIEAPLVMAMKKENRSRIQIKAYNITVKYTEAKMKVQLKKKAM